MYKHHQAASHLELKELLILNPSLQLEQGQLVLSMTNNAVFWLGIVSASKELPCKLEVHLWLAAALGFCSACLYKLD